MGTVTREPVIEAFQPSDLPRLLDIWKESLGDAFPMAASVLERRLGLGAVGRSSVIARCARLDGGLVGFGYLTADDRAITGSRRMRLQAVVVEPSCQRQGIGTALARSLLEAGTRRGATTAEIGGGLDYVWPGVPGELQGALEFIVAIGFRPAGISYDLRSTPVTAGLSAVASSGLDTLGVHARTARSDEMDAISAFVGAEFEPDWQVDLRDDIEDGLKPDGLLLATDASDRLVGFARLHTLDSVPIGPPLFWAGRRGPDAGGLGPIGIARAWRGRGLGTSFLGQAVVELARRGASDVVIDFTDLLDFYGRLGFEPWMTFRHATADAPVVVRDNNT